MSTNAVFLMGNLTKDPELRYTGNGTAVAKLGLAVNDRYKKGDEWEEKAHFFNIVVWSKQAESCAQHLKKGSKVLVEGKLQWSSWETETGEKRSAVDVRADRVRFLSSASRVTEDTETPEAGDGEIPF